MSGVLVFSLNLTQKRQDGIVHLMQSVQNKPKKGETTLSGVLGL